MRRNVFNIAPGVPYLATFVASLLNGEIIAGISRNSSPLELARISIYVPTQRAGRALAVEFARAIDKSAALLPRILPLGGLDEQESAALFSNDTDALAESLAPAIEEIDRRLILAQLVLKWANELGHAIVSIGLDGEPVARQARAHAGVAFARERLHAGQGTRGIDRRIHHRECRSIINRAPRRRSLRSILGHHDEVPVHCPTAMAS